MKTMVKQHLAGMVVVTLAVVLVFQLFGVPLAAVLPWAFLLACPLMMLTMGHGHQHGGPTARNSRDASDAPDRKQDTTL